MSSANWVMANGVFDVFHIGHLLHLEAASKMGDRLVVAVTSDIFVNKGPGRPIFNQSQRGGILQALRCVDHVIIVDDVLDAMKEIKPEIFVKHREYEGRLDPRHMTYFTENNIQVRFTDTPKFSSTALLSGKSR